MAAKGWGPRISTDKLKTAESSRRANSLPESWANVPTATPPQSEPDTNTTNAKHTASDKQACSSSVPGSCDPPTDTEQNYQILDFPDATDIHIADNWDCAIFGGGCCGGNPAYRYLVCGAVLHEASSVFAEERDAEALLTFTRHPNYPEGEPIPAFFTGLCGGCSSRELEAILRIIHFKADDRLFDIDFRSLMIIARICAGYSLQGPLRPWSEIWLRKHESKALLPGYESWLQITDIFGTNKRVEELVELLGDECSGIVEDTAIRYGADGSQPVVTINWPAKRRAQIISRRNFRIGHLYGSLWVLILSLKHPYVTEDHCSSKKCLALAYGSLLLSIQEAGLQDFLNSGGIWRGSARELENAMSRITFETLDSIRLSHRCLIPGFRAGFKSCILSRDLTNDTDRLNKIICYEEFDSPPPLDQNLKFLQSDPLSNMWFLVALFIFVHLGGSTILVLLLLLLLLLCRKP
ncbi:hypothetical protein TWF730_010097 [Orbilia blumenaviensis]|uniref:Uncharacterized protein n=1 Tax=Orbilia blumenaviensis TaxID=1796055 RepID=A0AAV9UWV7_9PEZI